MFELNHALLVAGGVVAGFINALAGGGSALTVPLLMMCGLDARVANGTNRLAVFAQSGSAAISYQRGGLRPWQAVRWAAPPTLLGAAAGTSMATAISPQMTQTIFGVVFGLLAIVTIAKPAWLNPAGAQTAHPPGKGGRVALAAVGFYGGFFQAGVGVPLLIVCARSMGLDLIAGNAVKVLLILAYTAFAVAAFAWAGHIAWFEGGLLVAGGLVGSYFGARAAIARGAVLVRVTLFVALVAAAISMLL